MAKLASKTYGDALFELAQEENKIDDLYAQVQVLQTVLKDNPDFSRLMNHPKIVKEEKEAVMEAVLKGRVSDEMAGFFHIIVTNNRYPEIFDILDYFTKQVKEYKRIGTAYVSTPLPLSDAQKQAVEKKLLDTTDYDSMEMNYDVNPSLIGGMIIRIGDKVVDSSVRSKLDELTKDLKKIQLARYEAGTQI
ncbi:MAG: F0F1 ATP synthase subunit delta [Lachnospiraceae bacterium]|nr:F0F1 ATP synthase subunit delta [Lachnospiraceae bacterium]